MDECARAAHELCTVLEGFTTERYVRRVVSSDPSTVSPQAIAAHVCGAAHRYADYILKAQGRPHVDRFLLEPEALPTPTSVRPCLAASLRHTEVAVEPMLAWDEAQVLALTFPVRWGPTYDPEMILEHAVCHLLRHRRQLERWPA
jgi:hypothetical protein